MNRNITHALVSVLRTIVSEGELVVARGQEQREILSSLTKIRNPCERFLVVPGRRNNVFAQLAETAWVLGGRDDLEFLSFYLPRAKEFSDDGKTWRAAYGPRIRNWGGRVDQVANVVDRLTEDPNTKRAVISIFDPGSDFQSTKDVPCNNWLQFIQRNGRLDLHVTVRANDAIWGFSGINFFEWSVLLEIISRTLGWEVGTLSWYVGTFHVYDRHYKVAERLCLTNDLRSPYEFGIVPTRIETTVGSLDQTITELFAAEEQARAGNFDAARKIEVNIKDPFFRSTATMLRLYNALKTEHDASKIRKVLEDLGDTDFYIAAAEYLCRATSSRTSSLATTPIQQEFFAYFDNRVEMQRQHI